LPRIQVKNNNLSSEAKNIKVLLKDDEVYWLSGDIIGEALRSSFINWNKGNIFGYLVEWNAFRGISMAMKEG
jgi:hypothetical protein